MRHSRQSESVTVMLAAIIAMLCSACVEAGDVPSPDFLSAALVAQTTVSIEVTCSLSRLPTTGSGNKVTRYYVRTPEAVYLRETYEKPGTSTAVQEYSLDKSTREYRGLGRATGRIASMPIGGLQGQDLHDPIGFALFPDANGVIYSLSDWVRKGEVYPEKERIGDYECWRVEIKNDIGAVKGYRIWMDPQIGFCPRRIQIVWGDAVSTHDFEEYTDLGSGVWYPMRMISTPKTPKWRAFQLVSTVQEIAAGKPFVKSDLIVRFPRGTMVHDDIRDAVYEQP